MARNAPESAAEPAKAPASDKALSFEKSLERLEAIVAKLENGDTPLEKSIDLYEEGHRLGQQCLQALERLEGRVRLVREGPGGTLAEEPLPPMSEAGGD